MNSFIVVKTDNKGEKTMSNEFITEVMQQMLPYLDNSQLIKLRLILEKSFLNYDVSSRTCDLENDNMELLKLFVAAKRIEGCSERTLSYYQKTIEAMMTSIGKNARQIRTEDLRSYLITYQSKNQSSRVTVDNNRRILS